MRKDALVWVVPVSCAALWLTMGPLCSAGGG